MMPTPPQQPLNANQPLRNVYQPNTASDVNLLNKGGIYPPSANEIQAAMLPRTRSKDSLAL